MSRDRGPNGGDQFIARDRPPCDGLETAEECVRDILARRGETFRHRATMGRTGKILQGTGNLQQVSGTPPLNDWLLEIWRRAQINSNDRPASIYVTSGLGFMRR